MGVFLRLLYRARKLKPVMNFRGISIPVDGEHITYVNFKYLWRGLYESPEIDALLGLARPNDRVLELGTGMGLVSGVAAKRIPGLIIETYEANPGLFDNIRKLHDLNGLTNITVRNAVLLPTSDPQPIRLNFRDHFTESTIIDGPQTTGGTDVPVDDIRKVLSTFKPDLMVCDIEGAEEALFDGISLKGLRALIIEFHPALISRAATKRIYDLCAEAGLYPRIEFSEHQVVAFERVEE